MTIPVVHEPVEEARFFGVIERCVFCQWPTRYWHTRTNNPVCQQCAKQHRVAELRNWRKPSKPQEDNPNATR